MATIPTLREAQKMVKAALKERVPEKYRELEQAEELSSFCRLLAEAMLERIEELDDPHDVLVRELPLLQKAQEIREARSRAVERVLADMLSTESLEAETSSYRSAA